MTNLERYRSEAKLSQADLAEISGISRNTISQLERGSHTNVTRVVMEKLAEALGKRAEEIFF